MARKDQDKNLDEVIQEEIDEIAIGLVRASAKLARERILGQLISGSKRNASVLLEEKRAEEDGVFINSEKESVGTLIKKAAINNYEKYHSLSCDEKSIVALGLNSIIDLTGFNTPQSRIFGDNNWDALRDKFLQRFQPGITINRKLGDKIFEIENIAKEAIDKARSLCHTKEAKSKYHSNSDLFSIYSQYLELMEFHSYVFSKDIDTTEADAVVKIWSPMIERLFRRSELRTKWGESVGDSGDVSDYSGFKIDSRVVKDILLRKRKEADKANCEVARINPGIIKITSDRTKLLIESKVVLDKLANGDPKRAKDICVPALQLVGNQAILYSLKVEANGLYVGVKEGSASVPNLISDINDFRDVIFLLFKFKVATTKALAFVLKGSGSSDNNNNNDNSSNNNASWVRDTWVPPSGEKKTRLPELPNFFYFSDTN